SHSRILIQRDADVNICFTYDGVSGSQYVYHVISSVLHMVSLHDLLIVEPAASASFEATGPPMAVDNLVLKAIRLLEQRVGRPLPLRIRLHKRVPVPAGLAGGSPDAAAVPAEGTRLYRRGLRA